MKFTIGKYEKALNCFKKCEKFDDVNKSEIALNNGLVFRAMAKYDEAICAFQEALNLDSNYEEAKRCLDGLKGMPQTFEFIKKFDKQRT